VGTGDGLCQFNPGGTPMFVCQQKAKERLGEVSSLFEDSDGTVWCGTQVGLHHL